MEKIYSFGYWVRRRRKALDLTQRELADRAACSLSAIKKIERDTRRPSLQMAKILADTLSIPEAERKAFLHSARGLAPVDSLPLAGLPLTPSDASGDGGSISPTGNLPAAVTPFFGRQDELLNLVTRLQAPHSRLITLTGLGGVGKSRLAVEAARDLADTFPDGIWYVPLAGVAEPDQISIAIAVELGIAFAGPLEPEQQLIRQLQGRQVLLILDNFEHLLPQGAELLSSLILNLPDLAVLVTSRERLRLQAELTIPLKGIPLEAARALFLERAGRAGGGTELKAVEAIEVIDELCHLVAGLPLAVELAAAWANLLTPAEILAELKESLALLAGEQPDRPLRHRSLQAVFAGSWSRLSPDEQSLLASLSVFSGSFTRDSTQAICGASLTQLARLYDQSLIQRDQRRFYLHQVIHRFAAEKLAAMPERNNSIQERHTAYYCQFMGRIANLFKTGGSGLTGWDQAIDEEYDNIRLAWRRALDNNQPQRLCKVALALWLYQDFRGQARQGLTMSTALADCAARVREAGDEGDNDLMRRTEAVALLGKSAHGLRSGQLTEARAMLSKINRLLEGMAAPDERVALIGLLGPVALQSSAEESGGQKIEEIVTLAGRERHVWGQALALNFLGLYHFSRGRPSKAQDSFLQAISIWQNHPGLTYCKGRSMVHLGLTYHALGDHGQAASLQEEALALAREIRDYSFIPLAHCNLGFHYYGQGRLEQARSQFQKGLAEAQRLDLHASVWHGILGLGLVAAAEGHTARAVTLLTSGLAKGSPYLPFLLGEPQHILERLRRALPPEEFAAAERQAPQIDLAVLLNG